MLLINSQLILDTTNRKAEGLTVVAAAHIGTTVVKAAAVGTTTTALCTTPPVAVVAHTVERAIGVVAEATRKSRKTIIISSVPTTTPTSC